MAIRKLPNGQNAEFPDWMTDSQISSAINSNFPNENKPKASLMENIKRYGLKNPAAGATKTLQNFADFPPDLINFISKKMGSKFRAPKAKIIEGDIDEFYGLPKEQNLGDMAAQFAPEIAGSFFVPGMATGKAGKMISKIPGAGKYLEKILGNAIPQMGYSASVAPTESRAEAGGIAGATSIPFSGLSQLAKSTRPEIQKIASGLTGAGAAALTGFGLNQAGVDPYMSTPLAAIMGILGAKSTGTQAMMKQKYAGGKDIAKAQERMGMAKELGLDFLTPEEAFNSPFLARKQGQLGRTEAGSELLYDKFGKRIESEQSAIHKTLKQIHDPKTMGPEATALYKKAYSEVVPDKFMKNLAGNSIINSAIHKVETTPAYKHALKDVPINTIEYLDHVKLALDDMIEAAPKKEARIIKDVKNKMLADLDTVSGDYKQARRLEERKFTRKKLEEAFDKTNIDSGHAFFKALNSKEDFEKLMGKLHDLPETQTRLKYMRELFKDFRAESKTNKVRGLEQIKMKQDRNLIDSVKSFIEDKLLSGKYDVDAINFITDPDWDKKIIELNKISNGQKKAAKFIELFGKGVSQGASSAITKGSKHDEGNND